MKLRIFSPHSTVLQSKYRENLATAAEGIAIERGGDRVGAKGKTGSQSKVEISHEVIAFTGHRIDPAEVLSSLVSSDNDACNDWICHFSAHVDPVKTTIEGLKRLSRSLIQKELLTPPRFIVIQPFSSKTPNFRKGSTNDPSPDFSVEASLEYLRKVLPAGAKFLEKHPSIGGSQSYGRVNAHGNPLDTHVAGICYYFPHHSIFDLARLLDVYLPTRLALGAHNLSPPSVCSGIPSSLSDDDLEAVIQNTDVLVAEDEKCPTPQRHHGMSHFEDSVSLETRTKQIHSSFFEPAKIWGMVWNAQRAEHCLETYAVVLGSTAAGSLDYQRIGAFPAVGGSVAELQNEYARFEKELRQ